MTEDCKVNIICRKYSNNLNVLALLKTADDRLYCCGAEPYVAGRGWGVYRYYKGEGRITTLDWCERQLSEMNHLLHSRAEELTLKDINRILSAAHVFRKGIARMAETVYPDDDVVHERGLHIRNQVTALINKLKPMRRAAESKQAAPAQHGVAGGDSGQDCGVELDSA
jgi:hypothetical protein